MASSNITQWMGAVAAIPAVPMVPMISQTSALLLSPWMGVVTTICAKQWGGVRYASSSSSSPSSSALPQRSGFHLQAQSQSQRNQQQIPVHQQESRPISTLIHTSYLARRFGVMSPNSSNCSSGIDSNFYPKYRTNHTQAQPASSTSTSSAAAAAAVLSQTAPNSATPSTRMATPTPQPTHAQTQTQSPIPIQAQPLAPPVPTPSERAKSTRSNVVMAPSAPTAGASMKSPLKKIAQNILDEYANKLPAPLPLKFFHEFGILQSQSRRLLASKWLKSELPVRLARRYRELELMPRKICNMPSILKVRDTYRQSFIDIVAFPDFDAVPSQSVEAGERIDAFVNLLQNIYLNHRDVARNVATGLLEFKDYNPGVEFSSDSKLQTFLDNFFTSRISIRLMIGHYLAAFDKVPGKIGLVNLECNPAKLVQAASIVAQGIARNHYHMSQVPDICIRGDISTTFPYIDEHVTFCARETLKNALRSVIEKYADSALTLGYPPIEVIIAKGKEDISVRISDKGAGVKRRDIDKIFAFGYTTAASPPAFSQSKVTNIFDDDKHGRIAGLGYGVPLARLYGTYFGGNMKFYSMEGHGTDVVFHFPKLQV